ncbi:MAG TPA: hypothetical protein VMG12_18690, partial [Polyangiaceae bacterium]|nr:hypothetical protein [Polyangiaceae bacterium]
MREIASQPLRMARRDVRRGWASGLAFAWAAAFALGNGVLAWGCATGVDVTDEELAEICSEPNTTCGGGAAGTPVGNVGGSTGGGVGGSSN